MADLQDVSAFSYGGEQIHLSHYDITKKDWGEYLLSLPHLSDVKTKALRGCIYIFGTLEITLFI